MIYYDSHKWSTLVRIHGSVLPQAMMRALPAALVAILLKYLDAHGYVNMDRLKVLSNGNVYSSFMYIIGFTLVFRTSQAYSRYWTAATAAYEMNSAWGDVCSSLIAFSVVSRESQLEVSNFRHTIVRLFSLLGAMALSEIASTEDDLPILDVKGLTQQQLVFLLTGPAQGKKVQVVLSWIKATITQAIDSGLLNVPAPILSHVFQELGHGLSRCRTAQQVVIWPFPFPYTQITVILIQVYTVLTPVVISTWDSWVWVCAVFSFVTATCMIALDLIASELENPFGDDPNDLPVMEMQGDQNKFLSLLLDSEVHNPPTLMANAILDQRQLALQCSNKMTLKQRLERRGSQLWEPTPSYTSGMPGMGSLNVTAPRLLSRGDRLKRQREWAGDATAPEASIARLERLLACRSGSTLLECKVQESIQSIPEQKESIIDPMESVSAEYNDVESSSECSLRVKKSKWVNSQAKLSCGSITSVCSPPSVLPNDVRLNTNTTPVSQVSHQDPITECITFMQAMQKEFSSHFDKQLELQRSQLEVQRRELLMMEGMLARNSAHPANNTRHDNLGGSAASSSSSSCSREVASDHDTDTEALSELDDTELLPGISPRPRLRAALPVALTLSTSHARPADRDSSPCEGFPHAYLQGCQQHVML